MSEPPGYVTFGACAIMIVLSIFYVFDMSMSHTKVNDLREVINSLNASNGELADLADFRERVISTAELHIGALNARINELNCSDLNEAGADVVSYQKSPYNLTKAKIVLNKSLNGG